MPHLPQHRFCPDSHSQEQIPEIIYKRWYFYACVYAYTLYAWQCLQRPEDVRSLGARVIGGLWATWCGYWEWIFARAAGALKYILRHLSSLRRYFVKSPLKKVLGMLVEDLTGLDTQLSVSFLLGSFSQGFAVGSLRPLDLSVCVWISACSIWCSCFLAFTMIQYLSQPYNDEKPRSVTCCFLSICSCVTLQCECRVE